MTGYTAKGLPFMSPEDGLGTVADQMRALAEAVDVGLGGWQSWTPAILSGYAEDFAQSSHRYCRIGNTIHVESNHYLTVGNTSQVGVGLPVPPRMGGMVNLVVGSFVYVDSGIKVYSGAVMLAAGSPASVGFYRDNSGGGITGTSPGNFTAGDRLMWSATYEAA